MLDKLIAKLEEITKAQQEAVAQLEQINKARDNCIANINALTGAGNAIQQLIEEVKTDNEQNTES